MKITYKIADISSINKTIQQLEAELHKAHERRDEQLALSTVQCGACGREFWIQDVDYTDVDRYYPYGYEPEWYWSHAQWSCKCGHANVMDKGHPLLELCTLFKSRNRVGMR